MGREDALKSWWTYESTDMDEPRLQSWDRVGHGEEILAYCARFCAATNGDKLSELYLWRGSQAQGAEPCILLAEATAFEESYAKDLHLLGVVIEAQSSIYKIEMDMANNVIYNSDPSMTPFSWIT